MIVPLLGGAPAVWIVCSLCFQTLLLAGYGYAHFVGTRFPVRVQVMLQLVIVGAVFLVMPVSVDEAMVARLSASHPTLGLLLLLLRTIGLPFFVLSTSSPLLQRWCAEMGERDPYHLYAASNAGSMLALLGYPLVIEPLLAVRAQSRGLHAAFAAYSILIVICAVRAVRKPAPERVDATPAPPQVRVTLTVDAAIAPVRTNTERWRERAIWIALSFAPSSLLLGATEYVTTDIASVPLLWVLPLALYLMSFIFAFAKKQLVSAPVWSNALALSAAVVAVLTLADISGPPWLVIGAHMLLLFLASVVCHRALAVRRPHVSRLTEFYLLLSIGGVLGGAFNGLLAPVVFDDLFEYPLAIGLVCLARTGMRTSDANGVKAGGLLRDALFAAAISVVLLVGMLHGGNLGTTLWADRGFFGVLKVTREREGRHQLLVSGRAMHGKQALDPAKARVPLAYYHPTGPAGDVLGPLPSRDLRLASRRVGVIGLGIGSLAAYARPGDDWTFFEINPAVVEVAHAHFTYLKAAEEVAKVHLEVGDARLRLREGEPARFDVLVLDAFSSDAVPIHLVTREALAVYRRALRPGGLLLAHLTNEHVRLPPAFGALAREAGMIAITRSDANVEGEALAGKAASEWVLLTESRGELDLFVRASKDWKPLSAPPSQSVWTDDYANVLGALRF
jgi:SAM-dependent methyltransferase